MRYSLSSFAIVLGLAACGDDPVPTTLDVQDVNVTTKEDMAITLIVPVSSNRPLIKVTIKAPPTHGTLTQCSTASVTMPCSGTSADDKTQYIYTPAADFNGQDAITLTLDNGDLQRDATVHITVTAVDDAPVANADSFAAAFNTTTTFDDATLLANDTDPEHDSLTVVSVVPTAHGMATHAGTAVTFIPEAGYQGSAQFTYTISDGMLTTTGTVNVAIGNNIAPVAVADTVAATEDTAAQIATSMLLANDTDADHQTLAITDVGNATHGTVAHNGAMITFTPDLNYNGVATFTYGVTDGAAVSSATVTLNIAAVNDAPVVGNISTAGVENAVATLSAATLLAGTSDVDGDTLKIASVSNAQHCTVALANFLGDNVTFTPAANFFGNATFDVGVTDGTVTVISHVTVAVSHVNQAPLAVADAQMTAEDVVLTVAGATLLANDTDIDGDALTVTAVSNATNGTVAFNGNTVTFTPATLFKGIAGFDYTISDGALSSTAHVTVTVTPVNHAPVAKNDLLTTLEDVAGSVNVVLNDTDIDADTLTIMSVTQGAHGTVTFAGGTATYLGSLNYNGPDTFTYTVSDGHGGTATATVTVTVTAVNDAPTAATDTLSTPEDLAGTIDVRANDSDVDGDGLTVTAVTQGAHGAVAINAGGLVVYTPAADYNGPDMFTYTISDGNGGTSVGTVIVTVVPVNDAPVAKADAFNTTANKNLTITAPGVLGNDTDIDSQNLTAVLNVGPTCGTLTLNPNGSFLYVPNGQCTGDSFTYHAFDGMLSSNVVTVTITINPVAIDDDYVMTGSGFGAGSCFNQSSTVVAAAEPRSGVDRTATSISTTVGTDEVPTITAPVSCGGPTPPGTGSGSGSSTTADVGVTLSDFVTHVVPNQTITYTFTVTEFTNPVSLPVIKPTVQFLADSNLTNVTYTCVANSGADCLGPSGSGSELAAGKSVNLVNHGVVTFTITATVGPFAQAFIQSKGAVVAVGYTDTNSCNNTATDTDSVFSNQGVLTNDLPSNGLFVTDTRFNASTTNGGRVDLCDDGSFQYRAPVNVCNTPLCQSGSCSDTFTYSDTDDDSGLTSNVATVTMHFICNIIIDDG